MGVTCSRCMKSSGHRCLCKTFKKHCVLAIFSFPWRCRIPRDAADRLLYSLKYLFHQKFLWKLMIYKKWILVFNLVFLISVDHSETEALWGYPPTQPTVFRCLRCSSWARVEVHGAAFELPTQNHSALSHLVVHFLSWKSPTLSLPCEAQAALTATGPERRSPFPTLPAAQTLERARKPTRRQIQIAWVFVIAPTQAGQSISWPAGPVWAWGSSLKWTGQEVGGHRTQATLALGVCLAQNSKII